MARKYLKGVAILTAAASIGLGVAIRQSSGDFSYSIPPNFVDSETIKVVNPRGYKYKSDSYSRIVTTDKSCEVVLAAFTKGFFGGPGFLLQRNIYELIWKEKYQIVGFTALDDNLCLDNMKTYMKNFICAMPVSSSDLAIWNAQDISATEVLPLNTVLYAAFQLHRRECSEDGGYLDFVFGSDLATFSGCHRFEVNRIDKNKIRVSLHHLACNPNLNEYSKIEYIEDFLHYVYARVLFANAIQEISRD